VIVATEGERRIERRTVGARASCSKPGVAALATLLVSFLALTIATPPAPLVIWNASRSSPTGLYLISKSARLHVGDFAAARLPSAVRGVAAGRRYLPRRVLLIKRVAAVTGDIVCARGSAVRIAGRLSVTRRVRDPSGRPLPWWSGCTRLADGELLLLSSSPTAFDGRYFGPTKRKEVVGSAVPLWVR